MGSKDSIRLKPKATAAAAVNVQAAASKPANAWLFSGDDDLEGEELLDDEELLTEEDRQRPVGACQHSARVSVTVRCNGAFCWKIAAPS